MRTRPSIPLMGVIILFTAKALAYWPPLREVVAELENPRTGEWKLNYRVYDPAVRTWHSNSSGFFIAESVTVVTNAGIVLWTENTGVTSIVHFTVYDPGVGRWQTTNSAPILNNASGYTREGMVVLGRWNDSPASPRTKVIGSYDPSLQRWITYTYAPFIIGASALLAIMAFSIFGFMATYEYSEASNDCLGR